MSVYGARVKVLDGVIRLVGDSEAIFIAPKYVVRFVEVLLSNPYNALHAEATLEALEHVAEELRNISWEEWPEPLKLVVPKRYAGHLLEKWIPELIDFIRYTTHVVS